MKKQSLNLVLLLVMGIVISGPLVVPDTAWAYELWCGKHNDGVSEYEVNPSWTDACAGTYQEQIDEVRTAAEEWNNAGEACFEFVYDGTTTISTVSLFDGHNVIYSSSMGGGGAIAATYCGGSVDWGWDMQFFDSGIPLCIDQRYDIQGVTVHELGHALGLGHASSCGGTCTDRPTMCPNVCSNGISERTIEDDEKAGIQFIYGYCPNCWDSDGDGYDDEACGGVDCNDSNPSVHPCGEEICGNGVDEDCSEGDRVCEGIQEEEPNDTHGWATELGTVDGGIVAQGHLCTTGHTGSTYTGDRDYFAFELSDPGYAPMVRIDLEWSSDGNFDIWLYNEYGSTMLVKATTTSNPEVLFYQAVPDQEFKLMVAGYSGEGGDYLLKISQGQCMDGDGDGYQGEICGGQDCDDADPGVNPDAVEICDDEIDNDCDGDMDYADIECTCYDNDGDGYAAVECGGKDCADDNPDINPAAVELCDGIDNDCSGEVDDKDADHDGYVDEACGGLDCDDTDLGVRPGANEGCDFIDTDCDGFLGELEFDDDGDLMTECEGDCDDSDPLTYLDAPEICDFRDNDCDGSADEGPCLVIEALALLGIAGCLLNGEEPLPEPEEDDGGGGGGGCGCALYRSPMRSALASSAIVYLVPALFILFMKRRERR